MGIISFWWSFVIVDEFSSDRQTLNSSYELNVALGLTQLKYNIVYSTQQEKRFRFLIYCTHKIFNDKKKILTLFSKEKN